VLWNVSSYLSVNASAGTLLWEPELFFEEWLSTCFHAYSGCANDILSEYTLLLPSENSDFTVQYDGWISVVLCVISRVKSSWWRTLLEKLNVPLLVKKLPVFCGTWRFITMFTRVCDMFLSWEESSSPPPIIYLENPF
jgi:hypothetical protein